MKLQITRLLESALASLPLGTLPDAVALPAIEIERTRDPLHGDFASNIAMRLAKVARRNPRQLAQAIVDALPASETIAKVEIAGAGFINFHLAPQAYREELLRIIDQHARYGRSAMGQGQRILLEFVSANPTGPLHVGTGRHAAYGATLANLLEAAGFEVHREYYINDAGRQMDIFASSVWLRYLELCGVEFAFPSNGYRGDYILPIAQALFEAVGRRYQRSAGEIFTGLVPDAPAGDMDQHVDAVIARARELLGEGYQVILEHGLRQMLAAIHTDLAEFGVTFDDWRSERTLFDSGLVDRTLELLKSKDEIYQKDGAWWFRTTQHGDEKDRVVVRENGQKTYFASDIAYHLDKSERGFDLLINVWGADHHGYIPRVKAGLAALGKSPDLLEVRLIQLVALFKGGEPVAMGKRSGEFVTLRDLRAEVGNDAARLFYVMRSNDQHLDFDLELAKSTSNDNPVYYLQYAHARVASVMRQLREKGYEFDVQAAKSSLASLQETHEQALIASMSRYPETIENCALHRAPHALVHYLRELANDFHTYYNAHQFIVPDASTRNARLLLITAFQQVLRNGLQILGVSAPESM